MLSIPDIAVVSVLALLLFGPEQLPKMMRQFGRVMREVQNTSHSFIAEMERAADLSEQRAAEAERMKGVDAENVASVESVEKEKTP